MLAMMVCVLASCSDGGSEDPVNSTPKPEEVKTEITIDSGSISNGLSFGVSGSEQSISFSVNADWTLSVASTSSGATWCKASATSGSKGTANVKFTVDENTGYDDRSVSVTIKAGSVSKTFTITQKGADALLVTTNRYEVAQEGGQIEIEVKANIDYQMEISETAESWITEASSRALTTYKHTFDIALNEDAEKREGEITFKSGDKVETVKVYQAGGALILLSQNEYTVNDTGETISVDIKSNVEYGVQMPDVDWITDEASSRGMSSHTLKYVIAPNEGYDSRSAEIIFYDKNSDLKDSIIINQKTSKQAKYYQISAEQLNGWDEVFFYSNEDGTECPYYIISNTDSVNGDIIVCLNETDNTDVEKSLIFHFSKNGDVVKINLPGYRFDAQSNEDNVDFIVFDNKNVVLGGFSVPYENIGSMSRSPFFNSKGEFSISKTMDFFKFGDEFAKLVTEPIQTIWNLNNGNYGAIVSDFLLGKIVGSKKTFIGKSIETVLVQAYMGLLYEREKNYFLGSANIIISSVKRTSNGTITVEGNISNISSIPSNRLVIDGYTSNNVRYGVSVGKNKYTGLYLNNKCSNLRLVSEEKFSFTFDIEEKPGEVYYFRPFLIPDCKIKKENDLMPDPFTCIRYGEAKDFMDMSIELSNFKQTKCIKDGNVYNVQFTINGRIPGLFDELHNWGIAIKDKTRLFAIEDHTQTYYAPIEKQFICNIKILESELKEIAGEQIAVLTITPFIKLRDGYGTEKYFKEEKYTIKIDDAPLREALIKLYQSTNGNNWTHNDNWCSNTPIETWYGVYKEEDKYILSLEQNNLIGKIEQTIPNDIKELKIDGNLLNSVDVSGSTTLNVLSVSSMHNQLMSLNISGCTALETLYCFDNKLVSLNAANCISLKSLVCGNCKLTSLNVSGCTALETLYCFDNQLTSLNVSGCTALYELDCSQNSLSNLYISNCSSLEILLCHNNVLGDLDISGTSMKQLSCHNNRITREISEQYQRLESFSYDIRYSYGNKGHYHENPDIVIKDKGIGWWYPGEPEKGYHGK